MPCQCSSSVQRLIGATLNSHDDGRAAILAAACHGTPSKGYLPRQQMHTEHAEPRNMSAAQPDERMTRHCRAMTQSTALRRLALDVSQF